MEMKRKQVKKQKSSEATKVHSTNGEMYGRQLHGGLEWSECLRIVGRDRSLAELLADRTHELAADEDLPPDYLRVQCAATPGEDYAQIDLQLTIQHTPLLSEEPMVGMGYAAFTPTQRYHFLQWIETIHLAAPPAFRRLYLAQLESNLWDDPERQRVAWAELLRLSTFATWQEDELLWRVILLAFQLKRDGRALAEWLRLAPVLPPQFLGVAMGQLAMMGQPLTVELLTLLLQKWQISQHCPATAILQLRLAYLTNLLGNEPLRHLMEKLDPAALAPKPWRTAHRHLRVQMAQPDLRAQLKSMLSELAILVPDTSGPVEVNGATTYTHHDGNDVADDLPEDAPRIKEGASANETKKPWQLVLEFGESRSEYFAYALNQAKRMPGYVQIMDEDRRMIHRVHYAKSEMRRFWSIWEYVQSWSSTQIYVNGKELRKWEIYPYSPYLR